MSFANEPNHHAKALAPSRSGRASAIRPRQSRWRRWGVKLLFIFLPCIALLAANFAYRHYRAVAGVQAAVAALDRDEPAWRLHEIEAARPVIPDDENSALVVSRVFAMLPPRWPPTELSERLADQQPQARLDDEDAAWLSDELCQRQDALLAARKLADLPKGRHPITYKRDFISTLLPTQQNSRSLMTLLQFDVMLQAQDGDLKGALRSCPALLNTARSLGDEPLLISQLIRIPVKWSSACWPRASRTPRTCSPYKSSWKRRNAFPGCSSAPGVNAAARTNALTPWNVVTSRHRMSPARGLRGRTASSKGWRGIAFVNSTRGYCRWTAR
jgi:hypothetical protein